MNTSMIKSERTKPATFHQINGMNNIVSGNISVQNNDSKAISKNSKKITLIENSLTFGYIKIKPNEKIKLGELVEETNVLHVVSGLALIRQNDKMKFLHKGATLHVNQENHNDYIEILTDNDLTLVWWDDVAEEDWFHPNFF